jgi:hypothetical protein
VKGVVPVDEEVVLLEEQLLAAQADIERLQGRLADAEARAVSRDAEVTEIKRLLATAKGALAESEAIQQAHGAEVEALQARLEQAGAQSQADASRYRALVLAHEPDLPADLVSGNSIDALEQSLSQARQTVAQVRQHIEQQAQTLRVPAGAPVRAAPDTSELSASEKIRMGLSNR